MLAAELFRSYSPRLPLYSVGAATLFCSTFCIEGDVLCNSNLTSFILVERQTSMYSTHLGEGRRHTARESSWTTILSQYVPTYGKLRTWAELLHPSGQSSLRKLPPPEPT
jgi:hypothetical protein